MFRVLIVEDNKSKQEEISKLIGTHYKSHFEFVPTITGAYAVLEHGQWDLVILDMTFQVSQGIGHEIRKEALAGIELLQYMTAKGATSPVIVATQHTFFSHGGWMNFSSIEELHNSLASAFPRVYRTTVRVDLASNDWHSELLSAVRGVLDVGRAKNSSDR